MSEPRKPFALVEMTLVVREMLSGQDILTSDCLDCNHLSAKAVLHCSDPRDEGKKLFTILPTNKRH